MSKNTGDGNNVRSPRPFVDDETEINNYLEKSIYGGEGNHYRKEKATSNPNRTRFTKFEENMKEGTWSTGTATQIKRFILELKQLKEKYHGIVGNDDVFNGLDMAETAAIELMQNAPENRGDIDEAEYTVSDASDIPDNLEPDDKVNIQKESYEPNELENIGYNHGEEALKKISSKLFNEPYFEHYISGFMSGFRDYAEASQDYNASIQKENKMKRSDLLRDYVSSRKNTNLNEQMETHKKAAKRTMLMEGAMKQFFELFEIGRTDEEIVLDYASKGVQVPEQFVSKARGQYDGLKKMKLELEMSEKEFKNSAKDIVNNPDEQVVNSENKPIATGIFNENKRTKKTK